jgi:hypothetical protein
MFGTKLFPVLSHSNTVLNSLFIDEENLYGTDEKDFTTMTDERSETPSLAAGNPSPFVVSMSLQYYVSLSPSGVPSQQ